MFFFKKKTRIVDCFTSNQMVHDHFPIAPAKEFIPDWFKKLNSTYNVNVDSTLRNNAVTVKRCPGITSLFNKGFVLPLWTDMKLDFKPLENNQFEFRAETAAQDPTWGVEVHDSRQYTGLFENNFFQSKITSPWLIKEKSGLDFMFIEPTYTMTNPNIFTVIPGVLNFKYQNYANINLMTEITTPMQKQIHISAGEPLAHIIPLTEDNVELRVHKLSKEDFNSLNESTSAYKWYGTYFDRKKNIEKKCPYNKENR
tara:strand:- start:1667 stop:2431 length:765 start_codon:yes stop_codon:yes gene_type:complete